MNTKDPYKDLEKQLSSNIYEYLKVLTYRSYRLYGKEYFCDVCLVRNRERKKDFVRLQKRWFGLSKKMKSAGETKPQWIVIKSYNFPQKFEFERVRKTFNDISSGNVDDISVSVTSTGAEFAVEEIKKLRTKLKKLGKEKGKKRAKTSEGMKELREKMGEINRENRELRKAALKSQIPEYKKTLNVTLQDLDKKSLGENHFQKILEKNEWMFGPGYEEIIPKRKADPQNQPDFVLKRYDGFSDVVEIEKPSKQLFTKKSKSGKSRPTSLLLEAVSQAMDYVESHNQKYKDMFYEDVQKSVSVPLHAYYPKGIVIIGRDKGTDRKKLRQLNNFLHNIVVLTYDEFLRQTSRMIEMLEK